jgi:hypothetical protein
MAKHCAITTRFFYIICYYSVVDAARICNQRYLVATLVDTNKVERRAYAVRIFQLKDVSGFYLAPVPLEFPGMSGDSFVTAPSTRI